MWLFGRRKRFALALEAVVNEKARAREIVIPVESWSRRVEFQGRTATVADHVYSAISNELSWWKTTFENLKAWLIEHWDEILQLLVSIISIFVLLL